MEKIKEFIKKAMYDLEIDIQRERQDRNNRQKCFHQGQYAAMEDILELIENIELEDGYEY